MIFPTTAILKVVLYLLSFCRQMDAHIRERTFSRYFLLSLISLLQLNKLTNLKYDGKRMVRNRMMRSLVFFLSLTALSQNRLQLEIHDRERTSPQTPNRCVFPNTYYDKF